MKVVYKIMTLIEWSETARRGVFFGTSLDLRDGYIHLSTADQVEETVIRHFADCGNLILVGIGVEGLGEALRFEPSRGGDLFPHLYADLKIGDILWSKEFDSSHPSVLRSLVLE